MTLGFAAREADRDLTERLVVMGARSISHAGEFARLQGDAPASTIALQ
jgi:hypothetical protein